MEDPSIDRKLSINTFMEAVKPVVIKKHEFEIRVMLELILFWPLGTLKIQTPRKKTQIFQFNTPLQVESRPMSS